MSNHEYRDATRHAAIFLAISLPLALAISYLLALAGEPQSHWFWHLIGLMP